MKAWENIEPVEALAGWAERNSVTIAVASANDGAGQAEREEAA